LRRPDLWLAEDPFHFKDHLNCFHMSSTHNTNCPH
jgi:hypothetical protein